MALYDTIRAELRGADQAAARKLAAAKEAAQQRVNEARFSRELRKDQQSSLRQRISSDVGRARDAEPGNSLRERVARDADRSRNDVEPGTAAGDRLKEQNSRGLAGKIAAAAASVGDPTPRGPQRPVRRDDQDETLRRAYEASHVSPPTDHSVAPVDDRGLGSFADFVTGTRPAEGLDRYQQTADSKNVMRWQGGHADGSQTVVTARRDGGEWEIVASEVAPNGRQNGTAVVGNAMSRMEARERALDWIEENPEGIPFHQQTGQLGAAGYATGADPYRDSLVFGDYSDSGDDFGDGGFGELVGDDDLGFVLGGDE